MWTHHALLPITRSHFISVLGSVNGCGRMVMGQYSHVIKMFSSISNFSYLDYFNDQFICVSQLSMELFEALKHCKSNSAGYGYSRTGTPPLYTCTCTLKKDMALACMCYPIFIECTRVEGRVANKRYRNLTYWWFLVQRCKNSRK